MGLFPIHTGVAHTIMHTVYRKDMYSHPTYTHMHTQKDITA